MTAPDMLGAALAAYAAKLAPLPPREDGSKRPMGREWTTFQDRRATREEIDERFGAFRRMTTLEAPTY